MAYFTLTDLKSELSEAELIGLTDDENVGIIDQTIIDWAVAKASGEFDSHAGMVMDVPLTTVHEIVKQKCMTIGIYYLFGRRSVVPETRAKDYDKVVRWMERLSEGKVTIGATTEADYEDDIQTSRTEEDRTFNMGKKSDGSSGSLDNY